jgi:putative DNA primase/helicase
LSDTPIYCPKLSSTVATQPFPPWRIKGILPTVGLATIYGPSTAGKSFLAIDIAAAIALGNDWFGHRVRQCPVIYVALEGEGGFPKRLQAWQQYNECTLPDELLFIIGQPFELNNPLHVAQLATVIKHGSVIIIDTLNRSAPDSDENASKDMGAVLAGCKQLQSLTQGLVILIHHTGKDVERGMRGHSSLLAAVDASIEVNRDNDTRSWNVSKSKDGGDGAELFFKLAIEHLGEDEDGDAITSCAIEPTTAAAPPRPPDGLKGNQKAVLGAVEAALSSGLVTFDDALVAASAALAHIESKNRLPRARTSLLSLIKIGKLILDTDTQLISKP